MKLVGKGDSRDDRGAFFREATTKDHLFGKESIVLPTFISSRSFMLLWIALFIVISVSVAVVHYMRIPSYAYGPGVAFSQKNEGSTEDSSVAIAVLLPPKYKEDVRSGQRVLLRLDQASKPVIRSVSEFSPSVISPETAQRRYALSDGAASVITQPTVVAIVPINDLPDGARATEYVGGVYAVEIEVGSQTAFSVFSEPIGQFLGGFL